MKICEQRPHAVDSCVVWCCVVSPAWGLVAAGRLFFAESGPVQTGCTVVLGLGRFDVKDIWTWRGRRKGL